MHLCNAAARLLIAQKKTTTILPSPLNILSKPITLASPKAIPENGGRQRKQFILRPPLRGRVHSWSWSEVINHSILRGCSSRFLPLFIRCSEKWKKMGCTSTTTRFPCLAPHHTLPSPERVIYQSIAFLFCAVLFCV